MRSPHSLKDLILAFICFTGLCACQPGVVFHAFRSVPTTGWRADDTLCFYLALPDSTATYILSVELRHQLDYPYTDLPVSITASTASDSILSADTLCIPVADGQGNRTGIGWGDLRVTVSPPLRLSAGGSDTLQLTLRPALGDSILPGVNDVGICIEKIP